MSNKLTWNKIYKDFKQRHPNLRKEVIHWCPYDYCTIQLWLKDGSKMTYNFDEHKAVFISRKE